MIDEKITEKQKLLQYLTEYSFDTVTDVLASLNLIPQYYKTKLGDHILINNINCTMFEGNNTKPGNIGCVCFYFGGVRKMKYHKNSHYHEILKKVDVYNTCQEVIDAFNRWKKYTAEVIATWGKII